ncbi:type II toxin-antitoxin system PemK/MazF family toxin [Halopenitus sp. POP-27]|uniref:type II toxin-antitoxin system PemK/MazF family toxin n=1 Tax=Halopenitus sp. POP-27 TaxID=2994425 RepID=UPI002468EDDF|nr:type II toxin-antitoxin system PemK/MazF family toxin [Halopenitus sp. POP-27]
MTAFEELKRGDVVWASDPLSEKGRPMLVLGIPRFPNHGVQLITVLISTRTYHEDSLTLRDDDYQGDPLGERSHVLPWSLATLNSAADVDHHLTALVDERTEDVASQVVDYVSSP